MTVTRIRPRAEDVPKTPQCCVHMGHGYRDGWSQRYLEQLQQRNDNKSWNIDQCQRYATHVINGKHYCGTHGGQKALEILEQQAKGQKNK